MRMAWRSPVGDTQKEQNKDSEEEQEKDSEAGEEELKSAAVSQERVPVTDISMEQLQDFDFVLSNFYTVDSTTQHYPATSLMLRS